MNSLLVTFALFGVLCMAQQDCSYFNVVNPGGCSPSSLAQLQSFAVNACYQSYGSAPQFVTKMASSYLQVSVYAGTNESIDQVSSCLCYDEAYCTPKFEVGPFYPVFIWVGADCTGQNCNVFRENMSLRGKMNAVKGALQLVNGTIGVGLGEETIVIYVRDKATQQMCNQILAQKGLSELPLEYVTGAFKPLKMIPLMRS